MPMYDYKLLLSDAQVLGNAADEYTDDEANLGMATPGLVQGNMLGIHLVVTTTFTGLDSGAILWLVHGAATTPTTKHTGMFIPVASLVKDAHFFVPIGSTPVLQYVRGLFDIVNEVATAGAATIWIGPKSGGEV